MTGTADIIRADARHLPLADNTVDLVVTSPPYFGLRAYSDGGETYDGQLGMEPTPSEFVDALIDVTRECIRVLKPSGSLWVNLGDKYATSGTRQGNRDNDDGLSVRAAAKHYMGTPAGYRDKSLMGIPWRYALRCIDDLRLILRAEVIWDKPSALPESVRDRVRRSHETWFHFVMQPHYYSAVDTIRPCTGETGSSLGSHSRTQGAGSGPAALLPLAMASSTSMAERCSLTELPTNCGWDPSQMVCTLTTCAATVSASTQHTSNPSPCASTCFAATHLQPRTSPRHTAPQGTNTTPRTPTVPRTGAVCAVHACEHGTEPGTGASVPLGSLPGSVWRVASQPFRAPAELGVDHFAAFPMEWPRRIIRGWSPAEVCTACGEGRRPVVASQRCVDGVPRDDLGARRVGGYQTDPSGIGNWRVTTERALLGYACACPDTTALATSGVVLDPFGGTGTTALVAKALGRRGISVDMSADYCRLAEWRTNDPKQLAQAAEREYVPPPKPTDGQLGMFEDAG